MKIAVDLRSLQSRRFSGVENYAQNLLEYLLAKDTQNQYVLFSSSWRKNSAAEFNFVNSKTVKLRWPNKLLNLGFVSKSVSLEKLIGDFDILFMPNLNQFSVAPEKKLVITVHDLSPVAAPEYYNLKRRVWHNFLNYKNAYRRADMLFAVSEWTKRDLVEYFQVNPDKIKVAYPGIDERLLTYTPPAAELRELRNRCELPGNFLLFLNTLEPRKNLVNLIKAYEMMDWDGFLVIAGQKGWKYKDIFRTIRISKKSAKIKYMGYVSERDKPALLRLSKALVYPSFYEGFGFQPLEAAACGVPVVTSSVTALPEVAGKFAMLVNPFDTGSILSGLNAVVGSEKLREKLIAKGLEEAKKFSWEKTSGQILSELNNLG